MRGPVLLPAWRIALRVSVVVCGLVAMFAMTRSLMADDASASATPTEQEIRDRVAQLGASEYRDRKRAESALRKMGSAAIEVLQENSSHENLEIKIRVQRLIGNLRSQFIQQAVPADLLQEFAGYEDKSFVIRKAKLDDLKDRNLEGGIRLLACLARFEESDLLAKHAALILLKSKLEEHPGGVGVARTEMLEGIELSRRRSSQWIRLYSNAENDPQVAVASFQKMVEQERADLKRFDKNTEQEIVKQLSRFVVHLQLDFDMQSEAVAEIKSIMERHQRLTAPDALEFWDWIESMDVPEVADAFREKNKEVLASDAILLYRLAKFYEVQGDAKTSRELADKAFAFKGATVGHIPHFRSRIGLIGLDLAGDPSDLELHLTSNPADETARRYLMAVLLDDEIGQLEWAEREYLAATGQTKSEEKAVDGDASDDTEKEEDEEELQPFQARARYNYSEMLHDQQREKEAAMQLQPIVDHCNDLTENQVEDLLGGRNFATIVSRMHYFYASDAAIRGENDEQRKRLDQGIKAYGDDVDVLIAMYRSKGAPEEWVTSTQKRIGSVIRKFSSELKADEKLLKSARTAIEKKYYSRRVAFKENQFAWLVGNTMGDIEEAIRCSEHSLEVHPGDGGHLDTLGRCYYRKGDFESAIKYQRMAVKAAPHELQIQRQLALIESEAPAELVK